MTIPEVGIQQLSRLFTEGRIAVFAGAGLSVAPPSLNPDWNTYQSMILRALVKSIDATSSLDPKHVTGFYKLISDLKSGAAPRFKPEVFLELLHSQIGDKVFDVLSILETGSFNTDHLFLARAAKHGHLRVIITTNFDRYIEQALTAENVPHHVLSQSSDFSSALKGGLDELFKSILVIKLHGSIERKDAIRITLRQAARALEHDKAALLKLIMDRYNILFYGYSANDDDISPVLHDLKDRASRIIWCLWSEQSQTPEVSSLLNAYSSKAFVVNQNRKSLFPRLSRALGYPSDSIISSPLASSPAAQASTAWLFRFFKARQSNQAGGRDPKHHTDQVTLNRWAASIATADVFHILGATSRSVSNFELAKQVYWKELDIFMDDRSWIKFANANLSLAEVLEMEGDYNSPLQAYLENRFIADKLDDAGGLALAYSGMAKLQLYLNDPEGALQQVSAAIRVFEILKQPHFLALSLNIRGEIRLVRHEVELAMEDWQRALRIAMDDGDLTNVAAASSNLSAAYRYHGDYREAKRLIEKAIELDERHGDVLALALSYGNLAFLQEQFGNLKQARNAIERSPLRNVVAGGAMSTHQRKHAKLLERIDNKMAYLKEHNLSLPSIEEVVRSGASAVVIGDYKQEEFLFHIRVPAKAIGQMDVMQPRHPNSVIASLPGEIELRSLYAGTGYRFPESLAFTMK